MKFLYFGSGQCGACKLMQPVLAKLKKLGYEVTKLNPSVNRIEAGKYKVTEIPTLIYLQGVTETKRWVGYTELDKILREIP